LPFRFARYRAGSVGGLIAVRHRGGHAEADRPDAWPSEHILRDRPLGDTRAERVSDEVRASESCGGEHAVTLPRGACA
jgi:hypothetical protein